MAYQDDIYRAAREGASGKTNKPIQTGGNFVPAGGGGTYGSDNSAFTVQRQGQVKRDRYRNAAMDAAESNMFARLPEVPQFGRNMRNALQRVSGAAQSTAMAEQFEMNRRQQALNEQIAEQQARENEYNRRSSDRKQDWVERTDARNFDRGVQTDERGWEEATRRYNEGRMDAKEQQAYERQRDERGFQYGVYQNERGWEEATRRYNNQEMDQREARDYERMRDAIGDQRYNDAQAHADRRQRGEEFQNAGKARDAADKRLAELLKNDDPSKEEIVEMARLRTERDYYSNKMAELSAAEPTRPAQTGSGAAPSPQAAQGGGYYQQPQSQPPAYSGQPTAQAPQSGGGNYAPQQGGQYAQPVPQQGGYPQQQPDWRLRTAPGGQQVQAPQQQQTQDPRMALRDIDAQLLAMRDAVNAADGPRDLGSGWSQKRKGLEQQREAAWEQLDPRDRGDALKAINGMLASYESKGAKGREQVADMRRLYALRDRYKAEMADPSLARRQQQPLQPAQPVNHQQDTASRYNAATAARVQDVLGPFPQPAQPQPAEGEDGFVGPPRPTQQPAIPLPSDNGAALAAIPPGQLGQVIYQGRQSADTIRAQVEALPPENPTRQMFTQLDAILRSSEYTDEQKADAAKRMADAVASIQGGGTARVDQPQQQRHWTEALESGIPRVAATILNYSTPVQNTRAIMGLPGAIRDAVPTPAEMQDMGRRGGWMDKIGARLIGNPSGPSLVDQANALTTPDQVAALRALINDQKTAPQVRQAAIAKLQQITGQM